MFRHRRKTRRRLSRNQGHSRPLRFEALEDRRVLAVLLVGAAGANSENPTSTPVDDGVLTLREAIGYVNGTSNPQNLDLQRIDQSQDILGVNDTIIFDPSLSGQTISLTNAAGGQLSITRSVTIDASMLPDGITIDASSADDTPVQLVEGEYVDTTYGDGIRIFNITGGSSTQVTLNNLTLTGGDVRCQFAGAFGDSLLAPAA
jgi:hypothetical protein